MGQRKSGYVTNEAGNRVEGEMRPGFADHAQFYIDVEGHTESPAMRHAMEELRFYCEEGEVKILGCYPANRTQIGKTRLLQA